MSGLSVKSTAGSDVNCKRTDGPSLSEIATGDFFFSSFLKGN